MQISSSLARYLHFVQSQFGPRAVPLRLAQTGSGPRALLILQLRVTICPPGK